MTVTMARGLILEMDRTKNGEDRGDPSIDSAGVFLFSRGC